MKKRAIKIIISFILFLVAFIINFNNIWITNALYVVSYVIVGLEIVKKAFRNIFRGKVFDENFLMTVATIGAFGIGEFPEAVAVMLFYQVGELFQSYAVDKSRKSISALMDIRPDYANLVKNGKEEKVDPDDVEVGDIILVKPGEKVPLDGIVVEGDSYLDTMALTGEAVPRKIEIGDDILSGCINKNSLLKIEVTKEYDESTVSKILELVENASNKKSKSENFISKFARYYTPIVVLIAVVLAIVPPLVIEGAVFTDWLYRALSFLVVSCPCALVISIPLSFFGGIGGASKMGVLIKGSNYLEALANTKIVVMDKTGTLTEGVFKVRAMKCIDVTDYAFIKYSAHAEYYSNHPIAHSIIEYYNEETTGTEYEIDTSIIEKTEEIVGRGIEAVIDGKNVLIGNEKLMQERNIEYEKCEEKDAAISTIIYMAIDNVFAGYYVIADKIKADSKVAIEKLRKNGVKKIIMLTGDRENVGKAVAKELQMDDVYTDLLPDGKVKAVEELLKSKSENEKLVFVGDGINDAPVLALADIGIAMGGLGSDAAIEAADVVIMTDEPSKISNAIGLSRKTLSIVKQNIIFAIVVKIAVLVLSAIGLSTMWEAVFADVGVSIIAILNALRVLHVKNK